MDRNDLLHLRSLKLKEHKVFDGDPDFFPLLSECHGQDKIYFSYWLMNGEIESDQKRAFEAFRKAIASVTPIRYKLKPRDMLVIDNGRMLHGRTAIEGNKKRFLKRYWIETHKPTKGQSYANARNGQAD